MGCASLSLLMRMLRSGSFSDKRILLIDKEPKIKNDRTWCFWETKPGFFEEIVYKHWNHIDFVSAEYTATLDIFPYEYKMIRGIDFYNFCFEEISKHENVDIVYGNIGNWHWTREGISLTLDNIEHKITTEEVFNSIYLPSSGQKNTTLVLQHFKGWTIETSQPVFDPSKAIIMDFRVHQKAGTTFAYVLPFSPTTALVEYTLFTKTLLKPETYDTELKNYIENILGIKVYTIKDKEFGVIPMTNEKLQFDAKGWNIGTAGGQTKGSSGYTFQFIQKNSEEIVRKLINNESLNTILPVPRRFRFYDNTLLHILYHNQLPGKMIFTNLFQKNKPQQVLRFLDNESTLIEELKIISSLPTWPFLKAALKSSTSH